ncbi:hypothetical protein ABZV77_39830 [Streptomyces sp. NPDC004732]|uniref:hypothetical protein n=1 Tax=Streptomyces sp. NPDC004732 TaxID=3154290 RepID=UPI0033B7D764
MTRTTHTSLVAVAAAFAVTQLVLVHPEMGLGWDETVYVSQVSSHAPAAFFSAPRARGVPLLVAPVAAWSSSTALLRVYLTLLAGIGLYVALRCWRGLLPVRVLALAGALFGSLWVTVFYGPQAMPNYWVATGALAAVGCFLRAQGDRHDRGAVRGLAASAALMALMRPTDAAWVALPLCAALIGVRRWRQPRLLGAVLLGLAAGAAEWVVEAYVRYGGLGARLAEGARIQGGLGRHLAVGDQLRSLGGRTLCRPCTGAMPDAAVTAWWFALPVLAAAGLVVAVRAGRAAGTLLALACAVSAAVPYLFLIGYAAPRFLLPAYALLAIPAADTLTRLVTAPKGRWRAAATTLVAAVLAGHLVVQYAVLEHTVHRSTAAHRDYARAAAELHRLGVRPPCLLTGRQAIPIAFYAGCASAHIHGHNANTTATRIIGAARRIRVAALEPPKSSPPPYAHAWRPYYLEDLRGHDDYRAYLAPVPDRTT